MNSRARTGGPVTNTTPGLCAASALCGVGGFVGRPSPSVSTFGFSYSQNFRES